MFPPCDTSHLAHIVGDRDREEVRILSLGQFRPEKDHPLQIKAMFELRQILAEEDWERVKLVIIGGCRGHDDWKLVQDLKSLALQTTLTIRRLRKSWASSQIQPF